jgi:hypothetical protein
MHLIIDNKKFLRSKTKNMIFHQRLKFFAVIEISSQSCRDDTTKREKERERKRAEIAREEEKADEEEEREGDRSRNARADRW